MNLMQRYGKLKTKLKPTKGLALKSLDDYVSDTEDIGDDLTDDELGVLIDFVLYCEAKD